MAEKTGGKKGPEKQPASKAPAARQSAAADTAGAAGDSALQLALAVIRERGLPHAQLLDLLRQGGVSQDLVDKVGTVYAPHLEGARSSEPAKPVKPSKAQKPRDDR